MKRIKVSNNVIRRLPRYLRKLDELSEQGVTRISSSEMGQQLGLTPSQIRQDLSCFGEFGQQGYGYHVPDLRAHIAAILGMDRGFRAVLVGVGNIGRALVDNFCFRDWGFDLAAAFDVRPELIGSTVNGVPVLSMDELPRFLDEEQVHIAVLAVPKDAAVPVAELLTDHGVDAIWNFTNVELTQPDSPVIVENIHFSDSLLALSYFVADRIDEKTAQAARRARRAEGADRPPAESDR
ncbi:MAG: redox-sensing transcriptional repressor Rex [Oscillospiraceae bacterium]|nr:redox-sensing transcriptional repressor Rex [Oscillospiraceae bacterium]